MWPHCVLTDCIKVKFKGQPEDVRHAMDLFRVRLAGHELKPFFHLLDVYMRDATRSGDRSVWGFTTFSKTWAGNVSYNANITEDIERWQISTCPFYRYRWFVALSNEDGGRVFTVYGPPWFREYVKTELRILRSRSRVRV